MAGSLRENPSVAAVASPESSVDGNDDDSSYAGRDRHGRTSYGTQAFADRASNSDDDRHFDDQGSADGSDDNGPRILQRAVNLGVRYYNFRGFTNRVVDDNWDYTVEVFVSKPDWQEDVANELTRRYNDKLGRVRIGPQISSISERLGENSHIHKVRIRSPTVIHCLAEVAQFDSELEEGTDVFVFCRPFRTFEHYHNAMKEKLAEMESAVEDATEGATNGAPVPIVAVEEATKTTSDAPVPVEAVAAGDTALTTQHGAPHDAEEEIVYRPTPLEEMRCYIEFVEKAIIPLWQRFDKVDKHTPRKVTYEDIPYLCRHGDLVYVPAKLTSSKALQRSAIQTIFKVLYCAPPDAAYRLEDETRKPHRQKLAWELLCLDFDGDNFRPISYTQTVRPFDDEREISSLACFPLKFHPQYEVLIKHHDDMGRRFKSCVEVGVRHVYHSGWSLVTGLFEPEEQKEEKLDDPEYIDSEVVIDFKEASRRIDEWRPAADDVGWLWDERQSSWRAEVDMIAPVQIWSSSEQDGRGEPLQFKPDRVLVTEGLIYQVVASAHYEKDKWVHKNNPMHPWETSDFAILPKRFLAYVLRERKFARLDIQNVQMRNDVQQVTLKNIQMKESHRKIISSAVSTHFRKKARVDKGDSPFLSPDMIQGKGTGLVILLHGAPGVGKTATAEAVAIQYRKPLFPITCGDLGTSTESVEKTLKEVFRYAHLWDCILLLDEADVFLTQRDRTDIERNALVSVFLRVLEYYSGILFLTTNRVGALDEAFRSRVHISLYYPHLSCVDTIEILRANFARLPTVEHLPKGTMPGPDDMRVMKSQIEAFIETEYEKHAEIFNRGPWDGRQIRNTVQMASRLALYETQSDPELENGPTVLTADHFRTVVDTMAEFDRYMKLARRADNAKLAHMQGDRYDDYNYSHTHVPTQYEPRFTSNQGRAGHPAGQKGRRHADVSPRGAKTSTPQSYRSAGEGYGGQTYPADRLTPDYRSHTPVDDHRGYEDDHAMKSGLGRQERNFRGSGGAGGHKAQLSRQSNVSAQSRSGAYSGEEELEGRYKNEEDYVEGGVIDEGRDLPIPTLRGTGKDRDHLWDDNDVPPVLSGKNKGFSRDDMPTRSARQGFPAARDDYEDDRSVRRGGTGHSSNVRQRGRSDLE